METKFIFISVPMTGFTDEQIENSKNRARKKLRALGEDTNVEYVVVDQPEINELPDKKHPGIACLGMDLEPLSECDCIFMCRGWENSKGCKVEHLCAQLYSIDIIYEVDVDDSLND